MRSIEARTRFASARNLVIACIACTGDCTESLKPACSRIVSHHHLIDRDGEGADDAALVDRIAAGDGRAFDALMRRHDAVLRRAILRITRNAADADDVRQETALKVWQHLHTLDDRTRVRAWILRIAAREALRLLASRRQDSELTDDVALVAGPDRQVERFDLQDALAVVLDAMPAQQAQCWLLRELGGFSYREIAAQTGASETVVRSSLVASRRRIQQAIEPICPQGRLTPTVVAVPPVKAAVAVWPPASAPEERPTVTARSPLHEDIALTPKRSTRPAARAVRRPPVLGD